jgi:hypothetical protein
VGGRINVKEEKKLENRTQLDEPVECASVGDPLFLYKILHLLFLRWQEFFVNYALRVEKKLSARSLQFQFPSAIAIMSWQEVTRSSLC